MRYLKVEPNTTTEEQAAKGYVNGTLEQLQFLLTRSPELKSYENQIQMYKMAVKFDAFAKEPKEYFELEEKEAEWIKKLLKSASYTNKMANGQEIPLSVGKLLADVDDMPNRKPDAPIAEVVK